MPASKGKKQLLTNASATSAAFEWKGGDGLFSVRATFGGGSVGLEYMGPDDTNFQSVGPTGILTANGGVIFTLPPGQVRAAVVTATAVYATVNHVGD